MSTQGPAKRRAIQATDKPVKRTRVSRACDQCRIAREKCNGAQPVCSTCPISRRACTYTANVKKRGIQPGYIRALELALAYLFQHNPENEILVNDRLVQGGTSSLLLSRESKESNKLHKRWRKTRFYSDVDKLLSGGEASRHDQSEPLSPGFDEEQSDTEDSSSKAITNTPNPIPVVQDPDTLSRPSNQWTTMPQQPLTLGSRKSIPLDSWRLLEIYFTYTQSWFPICSKEDILKLSYSYPAEGLAISSDLPDSGFHAELWSVLSVASVHDTIGPNSASQQSQFSQPAAQLYTTAKSLIPNEIGHFDLGHIKALLNLAIVNIGRSSIGAAWLLVGYACRILEIMDPSLLLANPRHKQVYHGCYLLDSVLSMHLDLRPYFHLDQVRQHGKVDEDGLDEWQPWSGGVDLYSGQQPKTPTLALSSINAMSEILALLNNTKESAQHKSQLLKSWETSLSPKLAFVCATLVPNPLTPPSVLLQMTYYCVSLVSTSSQTWLLRSVELLEKARDAMGWIQLPSVVRCLLEFISRHEVVRASNYDVQSRLQKLLVAVRDARPMLAAQRQVDVSCTSASNQSDTAVQTPISLSNMHPIGDLGLEDNAYGALSPMGLALPETRYMGTPTRHTNPRQEVSITSQLDSAYPEIPSYLEIFFDELASLDTVNSSDNQPQFLQNLGFAPDASMAELFSDYIPMQSSTFLSQQHSDTVNLDSFVFNEGG
jgi:hypothetical protein